MDQKKACAALRKHTTSALRLRLPTAAGSCWCPVCPGALSDELPIHVQTHSHLRTGQGSAVKRDDEVNVQLLELEHGSAFLFPG